MGPYKGRTPRRFQGPKDDPQGDKITCLGIVLLVLITLLGVLHEQIWRALGLW